MSYFTEVLDFLVKSVTKFWKEEALFVESCLHICILLLYEACTFVSHVIHKSQQKYCILWPSDAKEWLPLVLEQQFSKCVMQI